MKNETNPDEIVTLATEEPAVAETITAALKSTVEFHNGRGAMLRSLHLDPQVAAAARQLKDCL